MMRRAKYGIGAVVVIGLAWILSNVFNWDLSGLQVGLNGSPSSESAQDDSGVPDNNDAAGERNTGETQNVSTASGQAATGGDGSVDVRIEGHTYFLRDGSGSQAGWVAAELDKVVAAAKRAPGDDIGVRVRVIRGQSARASTESALKAALTAAGLKSSEIVENENLIDEVESNSPAPKQ